MCSTTLVGMITGRTEVNYHRQKTRRDPNSNFRFHGVEVETTTHFSVDCETVSNTRRRIL